MKYSGTERWCFTFRCVWSLSLNSHPPALSPRIIMDNFDPFLSGNSCRSDLSLMLSDGWLVVRCADAADRRQWPELRSRPSHFVLCCAFVSFPDLSSLQSFRTFQYPSCLIKPRSTAFWRKNIVILSTSMTICRFVWFFVLRLVRGKSAVSASDQVFSNWRR